MTQTSGAGFKRTLSTGNIPVYQRDKTLTLVQGGFALVKTNLAVGMILRPATPLVYDEQARTATIVPVGTLYANAANNATTYQFTKGFHNFQVGSNLGAVVGGASEAITAIDTTSSTLYDTVTVGTTLGVAVTAGQTLFASAAAGASAAALPAVNGLLYEETFVDDATIYQAVSAVIRATVFARRAPYTSQLAALPGLAHIIYSQSY